MSNPSRPGTDHGASYSPPSQATPGKGGQQSSVVEDFIEIFYAPSRVFARRAGSGYGIPLLIVSVVSAIFAFANRSITSAIFDAEFTRRAAEQMAKNPQITQEMINQQRGISEAIGSAIFYVAMPILIFVVGFFIWLAAKMVSAKLSYQTAVLIATFAQIPRLLASLLTTVQALVMDTTTVTSQHSVGFSPARFMDAATKKQILDVVGRFDVFTIWATVLIGIGIAVIAKVPRSKGYTAAAIVWGIATVLTGISILWS
jgi:Yip1-like protein